MARLPSPRNAVHRSLRIPDLREGDNSPSGTRSTAPAPAICPIQGLPTQRLRRRVPNRHVPNSIATMRRRLDHRARQNPAAMSMLRRPDPAAAAVGKFMTPVRLAQESRFGKQDFRYVAQQDAYIVLPVKGSPTTTRTRKMDWLAGAAPSSTVAPPARSDGSPDGSMSTFSRRCSAGSTSIRRKCASGARRSSIPSARSRPG